MKRQLETFATCTLLAVILLGCGRSNDGPESVQHNSSGQVKVQTQANISYYAAARFAEQVSFGATPELIAEIQKLGFEGWLDVQFALPASTKSMPREILNVTSVGETKLQEENKQHLFRGDDFWITALTARDQLRQRVAWSLFQYMPVSQGMPNGTLEYYNMLRRNAFGNYADLLRDVTIHPMMGFYLNNEQNRPTSPECLGCTPNENYARELMQLFSLGVVQLNSDGSTIRDAQGQAKETYTQKDVEELARALTGWSGPTNKTGLPGQYWPHFSEPMVPETRTFLHDSGPKLVLGNVLKAGMSPPEELNSVIRILMKHPNIAPFVSLRLIQHLVMSNPSPQYLNRISTVFRNNGEGIVGDIRAVVKAILLDPEAREADQINGGDKVAGKLREQILWLTAFYRGMGCKGTSHSSWKGFEYVEGISNQDPVNIPSIFSFYQATDRAPGSNLLAPEQKLLNTIAFTDRLGFAWRLIDTTRPNYQDILRQTSCNTSELTQAFQDSSNRFLDIISKRWFRGALPLSLRNNLLPLIEGIKKENWRTPEDKAFTILHFALASPYFGVIK